MMKRFMATIAIILVAVASTILVGCASIVHGTKQAVSINSTPAQAKVVIKTMGGVEVFSGVTPATATIPRKNEYNVSISLPGYKDQQVYVSNSSIDGWFWGNLACGGVLGLIIDASNGAMKKLEPDTIAVTLATASLEEDTTELYVVFQAFDADGQLRSLAVPMIKL